MSAKSELFDRLRYLGAAVELNVLSDIGVAPSDHNGIANLLRRGLGIVAFNILEDFVRNKLGEALAEISGSSLPFAKLTDALQEASIEGALSALLLRIKTERSAGLDWKLLVQDEAFRIHSTRNIPYELSKYSLAWGGSNVSANEVSAALQAFGIKGGWSVLRDVSNAIGGGIPDLCQAYRNTAQRRHGAAHAASFQYNHQWLRDVTNEIIAISGALDIVLTARCRQVKKNPLKFLSDHDLSPALNYRFLEPSGGAYKECKVMGGKTIKKWADLNSAITSIQPKLSRRNEFLIVINSSRRVSDWHA